MVSSWLGALLITSCIALTARVAAQNLQQLFARYAILAVAITPLSLPMLFNAQEHVISKGIASTIAGFTSSKLVLLAFNRGPLSVSELSAVQFVLSTALFALPLTGSSKHLHGAIGAQGVYRIMLALSVHTISALACSVIYTFIDPESFISTLLVGTGLYSILASEMYASSLVLHLAGVPTCIPFDLPFLSDSVSSFWNRWNKTIGLILRQLAFEPTVELLSKRCRKSIAFFSGLFMTFAASAALHIYVLGNMAMTHRCQQVRLALFFLVQPLLIACEKFIPSIPLVPTCNRIVRILLTLSVQFACAHLLFVKPFTQSNLVQQLADNTFIWMQTYFPKDQLHKYLGNMRTTDAWEFL